MVDEKIIDKIQKILAKTSNNSSEHEVQVAMLKAQEMLMKHGLTMADIIQSEETVREKEVINIKVTQKGKTLWWVKSLSSVIGKNFRCTPLIYTFGGKSSIAYVGLKDDVEVAQRVLAFAIDNIKYYSTEYVNNLVADYNKDWLKNKNIKTARDFVGEKNNYIQGFIHGIKIKFEEQVAKNNWGLILVQDNAVTEYIKGLNTKRGRTERNFMTSSDTTHFDNGVKQGKQFEYRSDLLKE